LLLKCSVVLVERGFDFLVRPNQKQLSPKVEPWIRRFIFLPLIAMGRGIDAVLAILLRFVIHPIQLWLISLFKPLLTLFARVLRKLPYRFVPGMTPSLQKCPQILPCAVTKYMQHCIPSFGLRVDRIRIDRPLLASAALFSNYVIQIVAFFHGRSTFGVRLRSRD
jgi:hypothetical protein